MKTEILISLLFDLLAEKQISAPQIAKRYGVSVRTALRYIRCRWQAFPLLRYADRTAVSAFWKLTSCPRGFLRKKNMKRS